MTLCLLCLNSRISRINQHFWEPERSRGSGATSSCQGTSPKVPSLHSRGSRPARTQTRVPGGGKVRTDGEGICQNAARNRTQISTFIPHCLLRDFIFYWVFFHPLFPDYFFHINAGQHLSGIHNHN